MVFKTGRFYKLSNLRTHSFISASCKQPTFVNIKPSGCRLLVKHQFGLKIWNIDYH